MNFEEAHEIVLEKEGGFVDDPRDPGGITKWGISLRFLKSIGIDFNKDGIVNGQDIRDMKPEEARKLYCKHFWAPLRCDELPNNIRLAVYDSGVNQGTRRAIKFLQKASGAKADGRIGPVTIAAVNNKNSTKLLTDFMMYRAVHYASLSIVGIYGKGWYRRLFDIHRISVLSEKKNV